MSKISSINQLKLVEAFIQLDIVRGFKYLDRSGEIINLFTTKDSSPPVQVNVDGMVIEKPTKDIQQFKVSPFLIWSSYLKPASLEIIETTFVTKALEISEILDVDDYKRIGVRCVYVYQLEKSIDPKNIMDRLSTLKKGNVTSLKSLITSEDNLLKVNLEIKPVLIENKKAIAFDLDVYSDTPAQNNKLKTTVTHIKNYLRSEETLEVIRHTLNG